VTEFRSIKRSRNRRLYDAVEHTPTNHRRVLQLILKKVDVVIVDSTGRDISAEVLLRILSSIENEQNAVFRKDLLVTLIQLSVTPNGRALIRSYLEHAARLFVIDQAAAGRG
jgi:polyhydroxyalkanoate synthesis regulator protein